MNIKLSTGILAAVTLVLAMMVFNGGRSRDAQLADYQQHVDQLLSEIEESALARLSLQQELNELRNNLVAQTSQISSINSELEQARQQINPDYQQIEADMRQRLTQQITRQIRSQDNSSDPRVSLLRQFQEMNSEELGQFMSLQMQFGEYLQSLDISDERMEVVVDALGNMIADQEQTTQDFVENLRQQDGGINPATMTRQIVEFNSRENQLETLSYSLNQQELDALSEYWANQDSQTMSFQFSSGSLPSAGNGEQPAVFIGTGQDGSFYSGSLQLLEADPADAPQ